MASTYTDSNRLTKQGDGENESTWGQIVNTVFDLVDELADGIVTVDVSAGNVTLTTNDGATDQARNRTLRITGDISANRTITIPDVEKNYFIEVATSGTGNVTIKNISDATGVTVSAGSGNKVIVCDATSTREFLGDTDISTLLVKADNLSDLTNVSAARDNLSVYSIAESNAAYQLPVGSAFFTTGNTNPGTLLGYGTWTQIAEGRFIVGVGEGTDVNTSTRTYAAGNDSVGEYKHSLTVDELPAHTHADSTINRGSGTGSYGNTAVGSDLRRTQITGGSTGGDLAHENSPPAFGLYVWERTA